MQFSGGRALETLVKQHAEMSMFVQCLINNISLFFSDATVDIMPSPCTESSHAISVKAFHWRTRTDYVTRNAFAARNRMRPRKRQRQKFVPYSPSLLLKTLDTGILLLAVFTLELEMDYPSETSLCTVAPSPQTPLLRFFLRGGGGCKQAIWNG